MERIKQQILKLALFTALIALPFFALDKASESNSKPTNINANAHDQSSDIAARDRGSKDKKSDRKGASSHKSQGKHNKGYSSKTDRGHHHHHHHRDKGHSHWDRDYSRHWDRDYYWGAYRSYPAYYQSYYYPSSYYYRDYPYYYYSPAIYYYTTPDISIDLSL